MVAADFDAYCRTQRQVDARWQRPAGLVAVEHAEHRPHGLVLVGPGDPRICRGDLERAAVPRHRMSLTVTRGCHGGAGRRTRRTSRRSLGGTSRAIRSRCWACTACRRRMAYVVRAFVPGAERVTAIDLDGAAAGARWTARHAAGSSRRWSASSAGRVAYRLRAAIAGRRAGTSTTLTRSGRCWARLDDHLLVEGTHRRLYERLGAHSIDARGRRRACTSPSGRRNARRVSVVGDFNALGRAAPPDAQARSTAGSGRSSLPTSTRARSTSIEIVGADGTLLPLKADPFGFGRRAAPVHRLRGGAHRRFRLERRGLVSPQRAAADPRRAPMSIYEVHLGSWRRRGDGGFLTYDEFADAADPLRGRPRLHPSRADADHRASARRLLGLPADRAVRADAALRRPGRLRRLRRPRARRPASA